LKDISEDIHTILTLWSEAKVASLDTKVPDQLRPKANDLWEHLVEHRDVGKEVRNLQTIETCRFYSIPFYH